MNSLELIDSFSEFKQMKNIDRPTMMKVLEDVFRTLLRKKYGDVDNFDIIVNTDKGDLEIWHKREIVADGAVENPITQIALSDAQKIEEDFEDYFYYHDYTYDIKTQKNDLKDKY